MSAFTKSPTAESPLKVTRWACPDGTAYYRALQEQTVLNAGTGVQHREYIQITAHHRVTDCEHLAAARCLLDGVSRLGGTA